MESIYLDEVEKRILNALIDNSRLSYRELAKEVHTSVVTISNKMKKFNRLGIIKKSTVMLDYDILGYQMPVFIRVKVAQGKFSQVEKQLFKDSQVTAIYDSTGDFDMLLLARFRNRNSLNSYLKKIQQYEFVERVHTNLILNVLMEKPMKLI
jgi:DNA-binding Lrp family transcriptional regulator